MLLCFMAQAFQDIYGCELVVFEKVASHINCSCRVLIVKVKTNTRFYKLAAKPVKYVNVNILTLNESVSCQGNQCGNHASPHGFQESFLQQV